MSQIEQMRPIQFKICVMGGKLVGKTHLSHQLSNHAPPEKYLQTTSVTELSQINEHRNIHYTYYDFPSFSPSLAKEVTYFTNANIIILLFKDSTSFTELFQFVQKISKITAANTTQNRYLWQDIKHIYIIYNNYEETTAVQTDQIFKILCDQVRNFNEVAQISTLLWNVEDKLAHQIKSSIQKIEFIQISGNIDHKEQQHNEIPFTNQQKGEEEEEEEEEEEVALECLKVEQLCQIQSEPKVSIQQQNIFPNQQQQGQKEDRLDHIQDCITKHQQNLQISKENQKPSQMPNNSENNKQQQISPQLSVEKQIIEQNNEIQLLQQIENKENYDQVQISEGLKKQDEEPFIAKQNKLQNAQIVELDSKKQQNNVVGDKQNIAQNKINDNQDEPKILLHKQRKELIKPQNNYLAQKKKKVKSQQGKGIQSKACSCEIM